ncbi:MAG TPA: type III secretion system chaperone [Caulifigura sp.]|nr:type III secretion system chaperone [Caulifigura sp.]
MTTSELLRQILMELGPVFEAEGISEFDDRTWAFVRDPDTTVMVELNESGSNLSLWTEIGAPRDEQRFAAYELALISNYSAERPTAPRLSLTGRGGGLQARIFVRADDLNIDALRELLTELYEVVDRWRVLLEGQATPADADAAEPSIGLRV